MAGCEPLRRRRTGLAEARSAVVLAGSTLPQRVHVIGWAGSGKTHLARRLSGLIDAPSHELDHVAYDWTLRSGDSRRSLDERLRLTAEIAAAPAWVTEGIYLW